MKAEANKRYNTTKIPCAPFEAQGFLIIKIRYS